MPLFRKQSTHRRVETLIREGVGVRQSTWQLAPPGDLPAADRLADAVLVWVRECMAGMRRPYGIDHVALALACRDGSGRVVCSTSLGVVRPATFYTNDPAAGIRGFLDDAARVAGDGGAEMVGALLSLGDIAFRLDRGPAAA
jgi:hypothetical protein